MTKTTVRAAAALALLATLCTGSAAVAHAAGLAGSRGSMVRQHAVAVAQDFTFVRNATQLATLADEGRVERLGGNADYTLADVAHPYARPEVLLFVERLAAQYHAATGERLVVTSLMRPTTEQPGNASPLSVHPAGMAVDLRVPADAAHREWLEQALLGLEQQEVLDVTREYHPPHFHVAVFPAAYRAYVERQGPVQVTAAAPAPAPAPASAPAAPAVQASPVVATTSPDRHVVAWLLGAVAAAMSGVAWRRRAAHAVG